MPVVSFFATCYFVSINFCDMLFHFCYHTEDTCCSFSRNGASYYYSTCCLDLHNLATHFCWRDTLFCVYIQLYIFLLQQQHYHITWPSIYDSIITAPFMLYSISPECFDNNCTCLLLATCLVVCNESSHL